MPCLSCRAILSAIQAGVPVVSLQVPFSMANRSHLDALEMAREYNIKVGLLWVPLLSYYTVAWPAAQDLQPTIFRTGSQCVGAAHSPFLMLSRWPGCAGCGVQVFARDGLMGGLVGEKYLGVGPPSLTAPRDRDLDEVGTLLQPLLLHELKLFGQ